MLVLARQRDQDLVIGEGENQVVITVVDIRGDKVRLGVEARRGIPVHRREIYERIKRERAANEKRCCLDPGPSAGGPGSGGTASEPSNQKGGTL